MTYKIIEFSYDGKPSDLQAAVNKEAANKGTWKIIFVESNPSYYRVWFEQTAKAK